MSGGGQWHSDYHATACFHHAPLRVHTDVGTHDCDGGNADKITGPSIEVATGHDF
jgi:hypothetical protein